MATSEYIVGRKRYGRPQGMLWSENPGILQNGLYVPTGQEIGANSDLSSETPDQFLILSDHGRSEININPERIERRMRTVNGRMRSYHIADKLKLEVSWSNLPSRAYFENAEFDLNGVSPYKGQTGEFTADGGAGGVAMLEWYETHKGPFWAFLSYDKYSNFGTDNNAFGHLGQYNQIVQVYFADFKYSVVKRGQNNHDLWNISVSLEEV